MRTAEYLTARNEAGMALREERDPGGALSKQKVQQERVEEARAMEYTTGGGGGACRKRPKPGGEPGELVAWFTEALTTGHRNVSWRDGPGSRRF